MIHERWEQRFKRDWFKLAILTIITTVIWLGMITYQALTKSQIKPEAKKLLAPLTSTLDLDTMKKIGLRETVPAADWDSWKPAKPAALLVPPISEASSSAEASSSGQLE